MKEKPWGRSQASNRCIAEQPRLDANGTTGHARCCFLGSSTSTSLTFGLRCKNLSRKAGKAKSWSGLPVYSTGTPARSERAHAATLGCTCAASVTSSHKQARSAPHHAGSLWQWQILLRGLRRIPILVLAFQAYLEHYANFKIHWHIHGSAKALLHGYPCCL